MEDRKCRTVGDGEVDQHRTCCAIDLLTCIPIDCMRHCLCDGVGLSVGARISR